MTALDDNALIAEALHTASLQDISKKGSSVIRRERRVCECGVVGGVRLAPRCGLDGRVNMARNRCPFTLYRVVAWEEVDEGSGSL